MAQAPTVKIGRRTFTLLFHDLLRPLTESERQALKNSIREYGIRVPISVDEDDGVIDGANRLQIAAELGLDDVPVDVQRALPHEWKVGMAHDLNDARRHLTPAERRKLKEQRVERIAEARRLGASIRTIAEAEGVSVGQVQRDLKAATVSHDTVEPEGGKVRGKDGKERSATRKAPSVKKEVDPAYKEVVEEQESPERPLEQPAVIAAGDEVKKESAALHPPWPKDYPLRPGHICYKRPIKSEEIEMLGEAQLTSKDLLDLIRQIARYRAEHQSSWDVSNDEERRATSEKVKKEHRREKRESSELLSSSWQDALWAFNELQEFEAQKLRAEQDREIEMILGTGRG